LLLLLLSSCYCFYMAVGRTLREVRWRGGGRLSLSALCSLLFRSYLRRSSWHCCDNCRPAGVLSDQHYEPAAVHAGVLAGAEPAASSAIAAPHQWHAVHQVFDRLARE
jgi:hypothetical protein